jgi:hypothetical protein
VASRPGARDEQVAALGIGSHIVESAVAADKLNLLHSVGPDLLGMSLAREGEWEHECGDYQALA